MQAPAGLAPETHTQTRFKLRFASREALDAALAVESADSHPVVINERRQYVSYEPSTRVLAETASPSKQNDMLISTLSKVAKELGAELVEDFRYDLEPGVGPEFLVETADAAQASLTDVVEAIEADRAWATADGTGVTIAIVDTGIDGSHPEFAAARRDGGWAISGDDPWTDWQGHGTMCACIAASDVIDGGRYKGVAPGAKIMSCKTRFFDSELGLIYDVLTDRAKKGVRIVASNSFGRKTGTPPSADPNSDFLPALNDAIEAGVIAIFSAGNNHQLVSGDPGACSPNSIWLHKSRSDLLAVATCRLDRTMWYYSSRGPGQHFGDPNTNLKPDVTAPTPKDGKILYGSGEAVLANGWGTSGACPQVAGLAALLLSANPGLNRDQLFQAIRSSAQTLGASPECQGQGLINCSAALAMV